MDEKVYQVITSRVINLLLAGVVPWQRPWAGAAMMPRNLISNREYRGVNVFLLQAMGYDSNYWLTYNQANSLGGHVKQGEKGVPVVFWKPFEISAPEEPNGKRMVPFLRYFTVFNLSQCADIPADKIPVVASSNREHNPITEAEKIVFDMPNKPEIRHGGNRACYLPAFDRVDMPKPESFRSSQDFYGVLFHELTHSTGHSSRLNRKGVGGTDGEWSAFGSTPYAREELIAEMGSCFLSGAAGIVDTTIQNSASYISSWLERLRHDCKLVVQASAAAQKSTDWILNRQPKQQASTEVQPELLAA